MRRNCLSLPMVRSTRVAQLVFEGIKRPFARHACALRDDRLGAAGLDVIKDGIGIICLVGDDVAGIEAFQ